MEKKNNPSPTAALCLAYRSQGIIVYFSDARLRQNIGGKGGFRVAALYIQKEPIV